MDVVPPEQPDLEDATKDFSSTLAFLHSCYAGITNPMNYSGVEAASDEWVLPPLWVENMHNQLSNRLTPQATGDWRWGSYYRYIGQCHLFLQELPNAKDVTEADKKEWTAEANFMIAYYHMLILMQYGPCPINDHYIAMNSDPSDYPGRSHFDYVTDWIVNKFDEVAVDLPATREQEKWGRATSTIAKALKARLLVYAASPLWNGDFPYPEWRNVNFETPEYGKELVSSSYDVKKWERAKIACQEALDFALTSGNASLYQDEDLHVREGVDLPFVPGVNEQTAEGEAFLKKVLLMRYLVTTRVTEGNREIIWGLADQGNMVMGSMPHYIQTLSSGSTYGGYSGVSPVLNTSIEYFYTKNGKRPAYDPDFIGEENWFKTAGIPERGDIITLNVEREPRFYAWFAFDGGDYSSKLANGNPVRIYLRNSDLQGYNPSRYNRDNNVTGYFSQKFIMPKLSVTLSNTWNLESKPRPLIRLAELYLNLAEAQAALGETNNAIQNLNVVRTRAGVPNLTTADVTSQMSITDWVRNERFIELWGEGHRYYDVRRWMIAPQTMGEGMRMGLNAYGTINPSFEQFNTPQPVDQPFVWSNRMYLLPIFYIEVYKNPQMVQAPGFN
ncbi:RagB/SusD family nutrient uptake outer membrane protein [Proteiniphilum sp.]|uniref:RagB/SusD family nutrient uptake outer membrane protein n=1 Tax=Proteiniphilum sp. TaxID=1926877 RepID=UPI0033264E1F